MKAAALMAVIFATSALLFAVPGPDDIALVSKYRDAAFDVGSSKPLQVSGGWKLYSLKGGVTLWLDADGNKVVHKPDSVRIEVMFSDGKEYMRSFELPSGRTCKVDQGTRIEWGVTREPAPDFALDRLGNAGHKVRLSDFRGKVVLLARRVIGRPRLPRLLRDY